MTKKTSKPAARKTARARKRKTVGESVIQGLMEAIAWTKGGNDNLRVTLVHVPEVMCERSVEDRTQPGTVHN